MYSLDAINIIDQDDDSTHPIPGWAKFHYALGAFTASQSVDGMRKFIALSVPTRHFCSSLVATGVISHLAHIFGEDDLSKESYFRRLLDLPEGTGIIRRDPVSQKITHRGKSMRPAGPEDEGYFRLQTYKGTKKQDPAISLLNIDICWAQIEIDPSTEYKLPIANRTIFADDGTNFRSYLFGDVSTENFYKDSSTVVCQIIGERNTLEKEIAGENFRVQKSDAQGSFQDIIRTDRLDKNLGYKTQLLSDRSEPQTTDNEPANVVIFDGARSFTKWKYFFTKSSIVVILDRTDMNYEEGILSVNQEYENRKEDLNIQHFMKEEIPKGVGVMSCYLVSL